jgi:hypothetical protein
VSELSVEIDRTALCIHTLGRDDGRIRAHMESIRAPVPSLLIAMATILVRRPFTFDDVQLLQRYTPAADLRKVVDAHVRAGMFVEGYEATPVGREAAALVLAVQGELISDFWRDASAALVEEIVWNVDDTDMNAFRQQRDALPEPASEAHRLLTLVTALRYLKSDVHAAALARHDISAMDASALEHRWRAGEANPVRDRVERETDDDFADRLDGRADELLARLRSLPGTDPR